MSKKYNILMIILTILITVHIVDRFVKKHNEHFGYIPRVSQVTYRRKHHKRGWTESARSA